MKKNLFAIEIAISLILFAMLLAGIFLQEFVVTWLSVGLLVLGGLAIVICKIINLAKSEQQENQVENSEQQIEQRRNIFSNSKKAWHFSTNGEKIKSLLFVFTIMVCCIAFIVLCSYGYIYTGLIVLGVGAAVIVIALVIMALIDRYLYKMDNEQTKICDDNNLENSTPTQENIVEEINSIENEPNDTQLNDIETNNTETESIEQ